MKEDDFDEWEYRPDEEEPERPRDPKTDEAKGKILELFRQYPRRVFYQRQVEVLLEDEIFPWIAVRALGELIDEGAIASQLLPLGTSGERIRFLWSPRLRYWKREAAKIERLVLEFSKLGRAIGAHGETMFDAALPKVGFMPRGTKVRAYGGREWTETGHDLGRVFEGDGIAFGEEIKNTLEYIPREKFLVKAHGPGAGVEASVHRAYGTKELHRGGPPG